MPRAARLESGSGSNWHRLSRGQPRPLSVHKNEPTSPGRVRIGPRQKLHGREQVPEMLDVMAATAAEKRSLVRRHFETRLGENRSNCRVIFLLEFARIGRDST